MAMRKSRREIWVAIGTAVYLVACAPATEDTPAAEESLSARQEHYLRQVTEDPADVEAHFELGQVYYEQQRYARSPCRPFTRRGS